MGAWTLFHLIWNVENHITCDYWGQALLLLFALGIALFAMASIWSGVAPNVGQLISARAVQGVGGALLVPGSLAIISASFREEQRAQAIGAWAGFTSITAAAGLVLGGWLAQYTSWRWVFFINVPLAALALGVVFWRVPESRDEGSKSGLDWRGALLTIIGLGALVYGLIEAGALGFGHPLVLVALAVSIVALGAFLLVETILQTPMVPLSLFYSRTFSGVNLQTLLLYAALGGITFFFLRSHPSAGLFSYGCWRCSRAVPAAGIFVFALGRGVDRPLWGYAAVGAWPGHHGRWLCPL
jgi:MFS family permease